MSSGRYLVRSHKAKADTSEIVLRYQVADKPWTPTGYAHRDKDQDAYFTLTLAAPELPASATMAKDVTLVIDRSGSMAGEAIRQARAACIDIVKRLRSDDHLNILLFDHSVEKLFAEPRPVTEAIRRQAIEYLEMMDDGGATDLAGALEQALASQSERQPTARHPVLHRRPIRRPARADGDAERQAGRPRVHRRLRRRRQQGAALAAGRAQARAVHVHRGGGEHRARGVAALPADRRARAGRRFAGGVGRRREPPLPADAARPVRRRRDPHQRAPARVGAGDADDQGQAGRPRRSRDRSSWKETARSSGRGWRGSGRARASTICSKRSRSAATGPSSRARCSTSRSPTTSPTPYTAFLAIPASELDWQSAHALAGARAYKAEHPASGSPTPRASRNATRTQGGVAAQAQAEDPRDFAMPRRRAVEPVARAGRERLRGKRESARQPGAGAQDEAGPRQPEQIRRGTRRLRELRSGRSRRRPARRPRVRRRRDARRLRPPPPPLIPSPPRSCSLPSALVPSPPRERRRGLGRGGGGRPKPAARAQRSGVFSRNPSASIQR